MISNVTTNHINELSLKYDYVFDCRGPGLKKNYLLENIGGYKIKIKCFNPIDKCYLLENGWFIHSDETNKYNLIVRGGFILGSEKYDSFIKKNNFKNIAHILRKLPFWKKYNCEEIIYARKGIRQYTIDMMPYYNKNKNIIQIRGGSATGCTLAPYIIHSIISQILYNKKSEFDFSISRLYSKYMNTWLIIGLIIYFFYYLSKNIKG